MKLKIKVNRYGFEIWDLFIEISPLKIFFVGDVIESCKSPYDRILITEIRKDARIIQGNLNFNQYDDIKDNPKYYEPDVSYMMGKYFLHRRPIYNWLKYLYVLVSKRYIT